MKSFDQQVADWARSKPADETYVFSDCTDCALGQFLKETGMMALPIVGPTAWTGPGDEPWHPISGLLASALVDEPATFGALADRLSA